MRISDWSSDVCSSDLLVEIDRGDSLRHHRADIRPVACDPRPAHDTERRERGLEPITHRRRAAGQVGLETPDAIGAEIRFGRGGMAFVTVRLGISLTAEPADFLRAEPDDADRAAGDRKSTRLNSST